MVPVVIDNLLSGDFPDHSYSLPIQLARRIIQSNTVWRGGIYGEECKRNIRSTL